MKGLICSLVLLIFSQISLANGTAAYSTVGPLTFVVESIVGDKLAVKTIVPDGKSPSSYRPSMKVVGELSKAKLLFVLDVFFEKKLIGKIKKKGGPKIINVGEGITRRHMSEGHHHHDAEEFDHSGELKDPHYWLSPENVEYMAKNVYRFMVHYDDANSEFYRQNHDELLIKIREMNAELKETFKDLSKKEVYVFHPSFGYFLDAYGLKQVPIEFEGKVPTIKHLHKIIERAKKDKVSHIFAQPQFSKRSVKIIARKAKAKVSSLNPLSKDIIKNWKEMGSKIGEALK